MSLRNPLDSREQADSGGPKIGFFGLLGSGNLGNDGSFEAVLTRIRADHPDAAVDAMCMGAERMSSQYGVPAIPLYWSTTHEAPISRLGSRFIWALGKLVDVWRTFSWVRRHDLVVVAGAGVLENSLPMRATGVPYSMFVLSASGRLARTKVALLSVGATKITPRPTRWLRNGAAHLAYYRSYREQDLVGRHAAGRYLRTTRSRLHGSRLFVASSQVDRRRSAARWSRHHVVFRWW